MILRRIIEHFRTQEWTAIAIDFVIVVVGVFVGLQVNNWSDDRRDRIDERLFLLRLHDDFARGEELTARLRAKRLMRADYLLAATDVIFGRSSKDFLDERQCEAIATAHYYNIVAPELPAVVELMSSGRMAILRDAELRTALVALQQTRDAFVRVIGIYSPKSVDLPSKYPDLIQAESAFSDEEGEVVSHFSCDLQLMRKNQNFRNDLSGTSDRYDAFVRDSLAPWSEQFDRAHALVDASLGVSHAGGSSE